MVVALTEAFSQMNRPTPAANMSGGGGAKSNNAFVRSTCPIRIESAPLCSSMCKTIRMYSKIVTRICNGEETG